MSEIDIRLAIGVEDHPKTKKLINRCGESAWRCLTRLWGQVRLRFPTTGIMSGWTIEDIELAAGWPQDKSLRGKFVSALEEVGYLDRFKTKDGEDFVFGIHDWIDEQPFAIEAEERRLRASRAGKASGESRRRKALEAQGLIDIEFTSYPQESEESVDSPENRNFSGKKVSANVNADKTTTSNTRSTQNDFSSTRCSTPTNLPTYQPTLTDTRRRKSGDASANCGKLENGQKSENERGSSARIAENRAETAQIRRSGENPIYDTGEVEKRAQNPREREIGNSEKPVKPEYEKLAIEWRNVARSHNSGWPDRETWPKIKSGWIDAIRLAIERDKLSVANFRRILKALDSGQFDSNGFSWIKRGCKSPRKLRKPDDDGMRRFEYLLNLLNESSRNGESVDPEWRRAFEEIHTLKSVGRIDTETANELRRKLHAKEVTAKDVLKELGQAND